MDLQNLTKEEKEQLKLLLRREDKFAKVKKQEEKSTYFSLRDEFISKNSTKLERLSKEMQRIKCEIFTDAQALIDMKNQIFKVKANRNSDTFTSSDLKSTIIIGNRMLDGWDDTVNYGIAKIKECLNDMGHTPETQKLIKILIGLLSKDKNGNLNSRKVLELKKYANEIDNLKFQEGVEIIEQAYQPRPTCQFIEVMRVNDKGEKKKIPLSMSAM